MATEKLTLKDISEKMSGIDVAILSNSWARGRDRKSPNEQ